MTEAEWLNTTDHPRDMLEFLELSVSHRKWRLFICGCCRHIWHLFVDERARPAVEVAERFADGLATPLDVRAASNATWQAAGTGRLFERSVPACVMRAARLCLYLDEEREEFDCAVYAVDECGDAARPTEKAEFAAQAAMLRDIFGNPFRPAAVDAQWLTPPVTSLAQAMYDERAFDRMPELADALEAAGCSQAEWIDHCRKPGLHVRGCWVVDLLLGKE